ncbi:hypothetical protein [Acinetobacter radioresistens]|uniref:hypothetical protein n=1 Tax=Acinetobacter radioresistens TaxID=40216 RepID=UPI00224764CD|nr:hypothetical protein [Acinetobacter radioresistens]MCX0338296.1 hypothetical protein [Acinetobacter radioresistens]
MAARKTQVPGATTTLEENKSTQTLELTPQPILHENHDTAPETKAEILAAPDQEGTTTTPVSEGELAVQFAMMQERMSRLEQENAQLKQGSVTSSPAPVTQASQANTQANARRESVLTEQGWTSKEVR